MDSSPVSPVGEEQKGEPPEGEQGEIGLGRRWTLALGNAISARFLGTRGWSALKATKPCSKRRSHAAQSDRLATAPVHLGGPRSRRQVGICNYGGLIDTLFTDVEGVA